MNNNVAVYNEEKAILDVKKIFYSVFKRSLDIIVSFFALLPLALITLCIKIAYIISGDFNPVIYTCNRIGKDGKIFKMYKFRTMIWDAEEILKILLKNEDLRKEYEENHKLENDPRITKVGNILRKTSIDELPQLLNVFLGDMALIGNRPYLEREKEDMGKYYYEIIKTKPGITGLWQVSGRNATTFVKRLSLEEYYSNNYSLLLDIKIFLKTFSVVLFRKGAK